MKDPAGSFMRFLAALVEIWRPVRFAVAVMLLFGGAALGVSLSLVGLGIMALGVSLLIAALHSNEPYTDEPYECCAPVPYELTFVRGRG